MKTKFFHKAIATIIILFAAFTVTFAQEPSKQEAPAAAKNEIMNENDRLPFMQTEEAAKMAEPSSGGMLIKTLGSMFLIIGLLFFGAWGVKKYGLFGVKIGNSDQASELKISSSISVANGQTLSVVRFGERTLLIGSTPQSFTLLADEFSETSPDPYSERISVSELLAEENLEFGKELKSAQNRLTAWNENGRNRI